MKKNHDDKSIVTHPHQEISDILDKLRSVNSHEEKTSSAQLPEEVLELYLFLYERIQELEEETAESESSIWTEFKEVFDDFSEKIEKLSTELSDLKQQRTLLEPRSIEELKETDSKDEEESVHTPEKSSGLDTFLEDFSKHTDEFIQKLESNNLLFYKGSEN